MTQGIKSFIYPVKDVDRAKSFYSKLLGIEPHCSEPYYVGFKVGDQEIGLLPNGHSAGLTAPLGYVHVADIQKTLQSLLDSGAKLEQEIKNVGGGCLVASLKDADGNVIGLLQSAA
jgi:predicted enzyme related to lactoylglutathione lyase